MRTNANERSRKMAEEKKTKPVATVKTETLKAADTAKETVKAEEPAKKTV